MSAKSESHLLNEISKLRTELAYVHQTKDEKAAELVNTEQRLAFAMRSANDGLWDWDLKSDKVYFSPRWKSMLGYEEQELPHVLNTWSSLVHSEDRDRVLQSVQDYLSGKTTAFEVEMRMQHKAGNYLFIRSRAFQVRCFDADIPLRLIGTHVDITHQKKAEIFDRQHTRILEMIAKGYPASEIYDEIARMYEERHPGMRCSLLELEGDTLLHGGAPSMPKEYCDAVHGLKNGPEIGSCGTSTYTGKRVLVENIETDPKWANLKSYALPHGMRCCWSEPIKNSSGEVLGAFGMYYDHPALPNDEESSDLISAARLAGIIMEREQNLKKIRHLAYKDQLTGLFSRAQFYISIDKLIKRSAQRNKQFSLLYIDLDNFKNINDSLGHDIGDVLIKECAKRLETTCRNIDFIARLSGDEFCIIVDDTESNMCAANIAQRCLALVSKSVMLAGRSVVPSCSIGIAQYPADGRSPQSLLKAADTALYEAKDLGKNCYAFYNKELSYKAEYRFKVEQSLREAIENQQLTLVYQPQIDVGSGDVICVEVLSRWCHPQLGPIQPGEFIGIAERIGMMPLLTEWVLYKACAEVARWNSDGLSYVRLAVNISPSHFTDSGFVSLIEKVLKNTGLAPTQLELEVTEHVFQTSEHLQRTFEKLKKLGVTLAIDDFGTGYSSFASLKNSQTDVLKIDKQFIDTILTDEKSYLLVSSMIQMGNNLGHKVVAEGIEEHEQFRLLQALKCDTVQGFLFSKPVTPDEIADLLHRNAEVL